MNTWKDRPVYIKVESKPSRLETTVEWFMDDFFLPFIELLVIGMACTVLVPLFIIFLPIYLPFVLIGWVIRAIYRRAVTRRD
jgi:predicted histidine transporter YuiF (NhaC family)